MFNKDKKQAEIDHSKDIEKLNRERDKVKQMVNNWKELVKLQLEGSNKNCEEERKALAACTEKLEQVLLLRVGKQTEIEQQELQLSSQILEKETELDGKASDLQEQTVKIEESSKVKQQLNDALVQDIRDKKKL